MKRFDKIDNESLWLLHADSKNELKRRGLIRTRNIVGERGEFIAIKVYSEKRNIPCLQIVRESTKHFDAVSKNGNRYSIKTITEPSRTTGVFYGVGEKEDTIIPEKKFEFVIIVELFSDFRPKRVIELTWEQFLSHRKWHSRMRAWNLSITDRLLKSAKIIIDNK